MASPSLSLLALALCHSGCGTGGAKKAATAQALEALVLEGLTDVVQHEVGHTLGLRHNFKGSTRRTWEQLHNSTYVDEHGLTSSVMDYLPPFVSSDMIQQPIGSSRHFTPTIGEYDMLAIAYGYSAVDDDERYLLSPHPALAQLLKQGEIFSTDEDGSRANGADPDASTWDMSDHPTQWYFDQLLIAKLLRPVLLERSVSDGESWTEYVRAERTLLAQVQTAGLYMAKALGGIRVSKAHRDSTNTPPISPSESSHQRSVLGALVDLVTEQGSYVGIFPNKTFAYSVQQVGVCSGVEQYCLGIQPYDLTAAVFAVKQSILVNLVSPDRLRRIDNIARGSNHEDPFTVGEFFETITLGVWGDPVITPSHPITDPQNRPLAMLWVEVLAVFMSFATAPLSAQVAATEQLLVVFGSISSAISSAATDSETTAFLIRIYAVLSNALKLPGSQQSVKNWL